ncbi:MAG: FeoC-like transcriptional regulator [Candidatus Thorarchaeota archaeon]
MLKRILHIILEEKIAHKKEIAKELGVQMSTLDDMLNILLENGYLRLGKCDYDSEVTCPSCPMADTCREKAMISNEYYVTDRGADFVQPAATKS